MQKLSEKHGYYYFCAIDEPQIHEDYIYTHPVVALASKFKIVEYQSVTINKAGLTLLGLNDNFTFSRQILRATIDIPHLGLTDIYVVHFKSQRSLVDAQTYSSLSGEEAIIAALTAQAAGGWGANKLRGNEAALLQLEIIERRQKTGNAIILMGDFNNELHDASLQHLTINQLRFVAKNEAEAHLNKYILTDSWQLFSANQSLNESIIRPATHYFGTKGSILDYILLSCEFDTQYDGNVFEVNQFDTFDQHLVNPVYQRDSQSTDHAIISISLKLRS